MEAKKVEQKSGTKEIADKTRKVDALGFIGDVKEEFHKISWTTPDDLRTYTKLVVGATFICGMGIYAIDLCIQGSLYLIGSVFHFIFG